MGGNNDFRERIIRLGVLTVSAGVIANFIPALYMAVVHGVMPPLSDITKIWLVAAAAFGISWIVQVISYFPMLGVGGSYIAWLCGSVADIRLPAATMAQKATNSEQGTPQGDVMAIIGITASVLLSVTILTVFTFIGSAIVPMLPEFVTKAFGFILPAIYGGVYAVLSSKHLNIGLGTIVLACIIAYVAPMLGIAKWLLSLIIIASGILVARVQYSTSK